VGAAAASVAAAAAVRLCHPASCKGGRSPVLAHAARTSRHGEARPFLSPPPCRRRRSSLLGFLCARVRPSLVPPFPFAGPAAWSDPSLPVPRAISSYPNSIPQPPSAAARAQLRNAAPPARVRSRRPPSPRPASPPPGPVSGRGFGDCGCAGRRSGGNGGGRRSRLFSCVAVGAPRLPGCFGPAPGSAGHFYRQSCLLHGESFQTQGQGIHETIKPRDRSRKRHKWTPGQRSSRQSLRGDRPLGSKWCAPRQWRLAPATASRQSRRPMASYKQNWTQFHLPRLHQSIRDRWQIRSTF
jgi:hypothetical protein